MTKPVSTIKKIRQQFRLSCDSAVHHALHRAKQRYGALRLTGELHAQGYCFNVKTVAASLRRQALRAKASRKFIPVSYREHGLPVSENLQKQDFYASGPNQKWSGDTTCLRTDEGWLYLTVVIDLWSRAVTVPVTVSARNSLKTRTSLRSVSTLRG
ncbi:transposase IS3 [Salmonella enterica subsp. enterica serovar Kentucky str. 22694]|nr:transposase [Salmonella enterica subsp. enterica serovar Kentucky str. 29439]ERN65106.1 transposase IS3 [Salmonella enterica subsp. enterica serovar Kentucky str. 13562]ERN67828.1 transposase IS3 [Salmonella enterica subsp. enterica serovar Kentucky str. 29166]ERN71165.1 transposase IS3 [Salmonella enterica subsp. enterica serovar Kentucky str. 22694]ERN79878.1 transposase IS3 [Salmonella enterica subsp. enterica serovar Kentucky str. N312]ERN82431.1 transposase IS3 [Salmonella enterica sub